MIPSSVYPLVGSTRGGPSNAWTSEFFSLDSNTSRLSGSIVCPPPSKISSTKIELFLWEAGNFRPDPDCASLGGKPENYCPHGFLPLPSSNPNASSFNSLGLGKCRYPMIHPWVTSSPEIWSSRPAISAGRSLRKIPQGHASECSALRSLTGLYS